VKSFAHITAEDVRLYAFPPTSPWLDPFTETNSATADLPGTRLETALTATE